MSGKKRNRPDVEEDENKPKTAQICSYCGKPADLVRPERHKAGYSVVPGTIPICWDCWDTVKRPDWRDIAIGGRINGNNH